MIMLDEDLIPVSYKKRKGPQYGPKFKEEK